MRKCCQEKCENDAAFKYTWPGKDESYSCFECSLKVAGLAQVMGLHLQVRPMTLDDYKSAQQREGKS